MQSWMRLSFLYGRVFAREMRTFYALALLMLVAALCVPILLDELLDKSANGRAGEPGLDGWVVRAHTPVPGQTLAFLEEAGARFVDTEAVTGRDELVVDLWWHGEVLPGSRGLFTIQTEPKWWNEATSNPSFSLGMQQVAPLPDATPAPPPLLMFDLEETNKRTYRDVEQALQLALLYGLLVLVLIGMVEWDHLVGGKGTRTLLASSHQTAFYHHLAMLSGSTMAALFLVGMAMMVGLIGFGLQGALLAGGMGLFVASMKFMAQCLTIGAKRLFAVLDQKQVAMIIQSIVNLTLPFLLVVLMRFWVRDVDIAGLGVQPVVQDLLDSTAYWVAMGSGLAFFAIVVLWLSCRGPKARQRLY